MSSRTALRTWFSTPPQPPVGAPPKSPRRPGAEGARPTPFGPWMGFLGVALLLFLLSAWLVPSDGARVQYSQFRSELERDNVKTVVFNQNRLTGEWRDPPASADDATKRLGARFTTVLPPVEDKDLIPSLQSKNVQYAADSSNWADGLNLFVSILAFALMLGLVWIVLRRSTDPLGGGSMMSNFIRSPAKRFLPSDQHNTFA
ncbi:MAG: hypothetical protein EHM42_06550, partial [Planctomycetaceae bacterium]